MKQERTCCHEGLQTRLSLPSDEKLDQRSLWSHSASGRLSPVSSVQSSRRPLGRYALGARDIHGYGELERAGDRACARCGKRRGTLLYRLRRPSAGWTPRILLHQHIRRTESRTVDRLSTGRLPKRPRAVSQKCYDPLHAQAVDGDQRVARSERAALSGRLPDGTGLPSQGLRRVFAVYERRRS